MINKNTSIPWVKLVKFTLPAVIISFLITQMEPEQWKQLAEQEKNYPLLICALLVAIFSVCVSFIRWCILVRCQGIELSMLEAFRLGAISNLLGYIAAGSVGGDVFKAAFLARRRPGKKLEAVASVLVDRGCGLFALLLIVFVGMQFLDPMVGSAGGETVSGELEQIRSVTCALVIFGTILLSVLVLGGKSVDRWLFQLDEVSWLGGIPSRIGKPLRMFHSHPVAFGVSILLSFVVQGALPISFYIIAKSLFVDAPSLAEHYVIVPLAVLASALPITFAGIGVLEAAIDSLYQWVPSVPTAASGFLVALVFEIVRLVIAVIGTIFYWTANAEVRESLAEAEDLQSESAGENHNATSFNVDHPTQLADS